MINITDRTKCSGCYACFNACPKDCISMELDSEGFRYPKIDKKKCVDCHLCEKACPISGGEADKIREQRKGIKSVACFDKNSDDMMDCATGGISNLIATHTILNGGVVFGVSGNVITGVYHTIAENQQELLPLKNSKYLQSDINTTFRQAKEQLDSGKLVFFTGTPCQIAGLYGYLGKDYDNLITADLICHGVPSETVFKKYIAEHEENVGKKVVSFARNKSISGWKPVRFAVVHDDGSTQVTHVKINKFLWGFETNLFQRPSCYKCKFATLERIGDITIGDWFGGSKQKELDPENKGLSMITINSPKGEKLYEELKSNLFFKEFSMEEACHDAMHLGKQPHMNWMRYSFFKNFRKKPFHTLCKKYFPSTKNYIGRVRTLAIRTYGKKFHKDMLK